MIYQLRDTESLVRESVEGLDCFIQGGRDQFRILFQLPNDRLQEVYLEVDQRAARRATPLGLLGLRPGRPRHYEFALKLNAELTYGSLSIREVNGQADVRDDPDLRRDHVYPVDIRAAWSRSPAEADGSSSS